MWYYTRNTIGGDILSNWFKPTESLSKISTYIDPGEGPFYTDYLNNLVLDYPFIGLDTVYIDPKYPTLRSLQNELSIIFFEYYRFREIGAETVKRFQYNVQRRTYEIVEQYETLFNLYKDTDLMARGRKIETDTNVTIVENKTSDSSVNTEYNTENKEVFQDTPVTPLVEDLTYATNITNNKNKNTGEMSTSKNDNNDITRSSDQTMTTHDKMAIEEIDTIIENYRTLKINFVKEYENCFINVLGRI